MGLFNLEGMAHGKPITKSFAACKTCKLKDGCASPKMQPTGEGKKGILFIAEAPGKDEDLRGVQLVGKAGQLHRRTLKKLGVNLDVDCRKTFSIICKLPKNKTQKNKEIQYCRPNLLKEIKKNPPKIIIPMGTTAVESLLGHRWKHGKLGGITKWRGWVIPDRDLSAWICPTFHPSFVLRNEGNKAVEKFYKDDLETAIWALNNKSFPEFVNEQKMVTKITDEHLIRRYLSSLIKDPPPFLAYDIETTGLKPHAKGHRIVSMAFSSDGKGAVSFPYNKPLVDVLRRVFMHPKINFIAANMKFEKTWTKFYISDIRSIIWDTMIAAHCLDNRSGITGLKFQTYIRYGLIDYDSHINHLLRGTEKNANAKNQIHKIPIADLLTYNGMDTIFTYRLAMDQMVQFGILDPKHYFGLRKKNRPTRRVTTNWNRRD